MRVAAGSAKGFQLQLVPGGETRPTSEKVREAIFAVLGDSVVDAAVLDLYAGTGALGIEALSRGASKACFVERRQISCRAIRRNLAHTRLESQGEVRCMPVDRALKQLAQAATPLIWDLVLADPPYDDPHVHGFMCGLESSGLLAPPGLAVLEHSSRFTAPSRYGSLIRWQHKVYGDTAVSFYELAQVAS